MQPTCVIMTSEFSMANSSSVWRASRCVSASRSLHRCTREVATERRRLLCHWLEDSMIKKVLGMGFNLTKTGWTTQKFYASNFSIMNQTLKEMNREQYIWRIWILTLGCKGVNVIPGALCWESMTRISAVNTSSRKIAARIREAGTWTETEKRKSISLICKTAVKTPYLPFHPKELLAPNFSLQYHYLNVTSFE